MRRITPRLSIFVLGSFLLTLVPAQAQNSSATTAKVSSAAPAKTSAPTFGFAIHGGAGTIRKGSMTAEMEQEYRARLNEALLAGYNVLKNEGTSLDAVEAAIRIMEDSPIFNAGKGAVFTSDGTNELDAAIMDGKTLKAGSVAAVKRIKNPISLARLVMEQSPHVLMVSDGAEAFAKEKGIELVAPEYFRTERRWQELQRAKEKEKLEAQEPKKVGRTLDEEFADVSKYGTVGAVALDKHGNLAAATSTGGKTNKKVGRVGDSPIIGAGTYANNRTCAVSGTGDGEYFLRGVIAFDVSAVMDYQKKTLKEAAAIVLEKLEKQGGTGGLIAIDSNGNVAMTFNTEGMYRGAINADGKVTIEIYKD